MGKAIAKVVYKPDSQSTDEYTVIVEPEEYKKYKAGDTSIPLTRVVDSFQVLFSNQGKQGILGQPSKQQLETVFGTSSDTEVIKVILQKGRESGETNISHPLGLTNITRGGTTEHRSGNSR